MDYTLYNGNISQTMWSTANNDAQTRAYGYSYDDLNRINNGFSRKGVNYNDVDSYSLLGVSYDKNGNIGSLERRGFVLSSATGVMDNLSYTYNGNQLLSVNDNANTQSIKNQGFFDGNVAGDDYQYDNNGNMIIDKNKEITQNIEYNHLNLPETVKINTTDSQGDLQQGMISYIYDATGIKLAKVLVDDIQNSTTTTYYAGGYIYENNNGNEQLKMFLHPEGYVEPVYGTDKSIQKFSRETATITFSGYQYVFNYIDHLGNVRLSYADSDGDGAIKPSSEIISEKHYYPFGLQQQGYNDVVTSNSNSMAERFKYNVKENNPELGLDWYDYGARNYNASIGRFIQVDNAAGIMRQYGTYVYAFNSPMMFIDKDGNLPTLSGGTDPGKIFIKGVKIDMTNAPPKSARTAKGFPRNGPWFWRQVLKSNPEMFSKKNKYLIKSGKSSEVDPKWVEYNPSHKGYMKDKLIHHHVDQGRFAVGIPDEAHKQHYKKLHSRYGSKSRDFFSKDPHSTRKAMAQITRTQSVGELYAVESRDPASESVTYQEVVFKSDEENEEGEVFRVDVYESYWYNEETKKYEGKGYLRYYSIGKDGSLISTNINAPLRGG